MARAPLGGRGIDLATKYQDFLARGFHAPAVATERTAHRFDAAAHAGELVRPHDGGATIATARCIDLDTAAGFQRGLCGVGHPPILALPAAAHQHLTTALGATGIYQCTCLDVHATGCHMYCSASSAAVGTHVQCAADRHGAASAHVADQQNAPALVLNAFGLNNTGVVDHRRAECIGRFGRQHDLAASGRYQLPVLSQRLDGTLVNAIAQQTAVVQIQGHLVTRCQQRRTQGGGDDSFIAHLRGQERNVAAICRRQAAPIHHGCATPWLCKNQLTGHEICVAQCHGGGHQPSHVDLRPVAKQYTVGVQDKHLAVGRQAAKKLTGTAANNAIQRDRLSVGLVEHQCFVGSCGQIGPVQRQARTGLVDGGRRANRAHLARAGRDGSVGSISGIGHWRQ